MNEVNGSSRNGYEIRVKEPLEIDFSGWPDEYLVRNEHMESGEIIGCLICLVEDQPRLRGILNHLWDLNRTVLSVQRINYQEEILRGEMK